MGHTDHHDHHHAPEAKGWHVASLLCAIFAFTVLCHYMLVKEMAYDWMLDYKNAEASRPAPTEH